MAYNPYDDINNIYIQKQKYEAAKANKGDPSVYANRANQYYANLEANGQGDLAAQLRASDLNSSQAILKKYATPSSPTNQTTPTTPSMMQSLTNPQYVDNGAKFTQNAGSMAEMLQKYTQPTAAQNQSNSQGLANLKALFEMTGQNNQNITAQGNDLWGQMTKYGQDQTKRYEDLYSYVKDTDFMQTPEGKSIMANYGQVGGQQAGNASAAAAGNNSGNIDSYSAANANRQQLAYTNAGTAAVLNQKNSNVGNMLATLQSLGVDVGDLQSRMIAKNQGDQSYNLGLMGQYTQGQDNTGKQLQAQQDASLNTLNNGLSALLGVNTNDAGNFQSGLNNATSIINTDNTNQALLTQTKLQEDGKILVQEMQGKNDIEKQKLLNQYGLELQQKVNEGQITINDANKLIAEIEAAADIKISENNKSADLGVAGINANADKYAVDAKKEETEVVDDFDTKSPAEQYDFFESAFKVYTSE